MFNLVNFIPKNGASITFSNLENVHITNCLVEGLIINGKKVEIE